MNAWIVALAAAAGISVAVAAPASADESEYLNGLQDNTNLVDTYSNQQLLGEGYKVCNAVSGGAKEIEAVEMVERDLSVAPHEAIAIYTAATGMLSC